MMDGEVPPDRPDRFVAADPALLRVVPLDALSLIYHRPSGITHVVAAPVPELLEALAEPRDPAGLLDHLASRFDLSDGDAAALAERLAELESVGLVQRA